MCAAAAAAAAAKPRGALTMWGSFKKALPRAVSRVSGVVAAKAQPQAPLFTATRATGPLTSRVCRLGQWRGLSKSSAVRGGGAAGRKRAFEADASAVPKSDGFHAAELRLNDAVEDDHTTVIGLRGFFVGHKLDTAALATDIAQFFPLYAQIQGRHNTIFALEEEHAEHPEVGFVAGRAQNLDCQENMDERRLI